MTTTARRLIGESVDRIEGEDKVTGAALYAYEYRPDDVAYAAIVTSTVAAGVIRRIDASAALALPGVVVLSHENAPSLPAATGELAVLQSARVVYRGQIVAVAIAATLETAREAAALVAVDYDVAEHDVLLRGEHLRLYKPDKVNPNFPTDTEEGEVDQALVRAPVRLDETYRTPAEHNNPMEPHATIAVWEHEGGLTLYDSNQGPWQVAEKLAKIFELETSQVRVIAPNVGGGFGSKGSPRPHVILAAVCAREVGRPVKLALTRQQMFTLTGYRTPTIQRVQLGAGRDGRLSVIAHDVLEQTSMLQEFAEQTAVATRMMYAAPNRRTSHRLVALNLPTPSWMRAPGETPGMFALESALDELAVACQLDPVELRLRNEPELDPDSGYRFSSRNLVACLEEGAARFGWENRDPTPATRRDGRWLVGLGVASSTYPARRAPSTAHGVAEPDGTFTISISASDIGTGARTVLTQIAAETLDVPLERVHVRIGDSRSGQAMLAGGSMGTASWGTAVVKACRQLRAGETEVTVDTAQETTAGEPLAKHAYGAQFVEVRVNIDTAEIRVPRMLGVFACGRIINPKTARSQLIGGMTMGLSMALLEETQLDAARGAYVNHDLATYHVATNADIAEIEVGWIDEDDPHLNPMGSKGIGEIGIVGTAAAIANATYNATGQRMRDLPITPPKLAARQT